jgi:hypothetical protein
MIYWINLHQPRIHVFRHHVKRAVRRGVRSLKGWLAEPPPAPQPTGLQYAYVWLNKIVEEIAAELGALQRPAYTWGLVQGAYLAQMFGISRISALELGVAAGNGLVALDRAAGKVAAALGVGIDVYGFDTGQGLPKPADIRDLPNLWAAGDFPMDAVALRSRLTRAELVLGLVEATLPVFLASRPAPIGFIAFDLDLYSSTAHALNLLAGDAALLLPRVHCYMDDTLGFTFAEFNGERLAIAEFNASHPQRKLSPIFGLRYYVPRAYFDAMWVDKCYMAHILDHPLYAAYDGTGKPRPWPHHTKPAAG